MTSEFKNGILTLETENFKIVYSNIEIVPYEEELKKEVNDIFEDWLYMYYDIELIVKTKNGDAKIQETTALKLQTFDYPTLPFLCKAIDELLNDNSVGNVYSNALNCNVIEKADIDNIVNEDTFELKKCINTDNKFVYYWLNISLYPTHAESGIGITFSFLYENEIRKMYEDIKAFIEYGWQNIEQQERTLK